LVRPGQGLASGCHLTAIAPRSLSGPSKLIGNIPKILAAVKMFSMLKLRKIKTQ
jgi:hypothetical protein